MTLTQQAGHQPVKQASHAHCQQCHPLLLQAGRPPEEVSGCDEGSGCGEDSGCEDKDVYDPIGLKICFRNKYKHKPSVLCGGGASLIVKYCPHKRLSIVFNSDAEYDNVNYRI